MIEHRITGLSGRIERYAHFLARRAVTLTADDLFQEAAVALLVKARADPDFLEQHDSYITWRAGWAMKQAARADRSQTLRLLPLQAPASRKGQSIDAIETRVDVQTAKRRLTDRQRELCRYYERGYSNRASAEAMGITKQAVDAMRCRIANRLALSLQD